MADRTFRLLRHGAPGTDGAQQIGEGVLHDDGSVQVTGLPIGPWTCSLAELEEACQNPGGGMVVEIVYDDPPPSG